MHAGSIISRNADAIWFIVSNFAVGLLFALPVKWAGSGAYDNDIILFVFFAALYVITGGCFLQRGIWSEILIGIAVSGSVVMRLVDAPPLLALWFPFLFLAVTSTVGIYLIASGRLGRPRL